MERSRTEQARRWGAIAVRSCAAGAVAGLLVWWFARAPMSACESQVRLNDPRGAQTCLDSYARSNDAHDLAWAAKGYMYAGELDEADKLSHQLLAGPLYGDAHGVLSYLELRRGSAGAARMHATLALMAHTLAGEPDGRAKDAISLSQAAWKAGDFTTALATADEALRLSRKLRDPVKQVAAQLARADALLRMGELGGAARALNDAIDRATRPCDQAWVHFKTAMYWMEAQQAGLSIRELEAAAQANRRCGYRDISTSVGINQAWLLRFKEPAAALAKLNEATRADGELFETLLLRGYLAADRGDLDEADRHLAEAERLEAPDADWQWEIERARAELAAAERLEPTLGLVPLVRRRRRAPRS